MSGGQRDGCLFCRIARISLFVISAIVGWSWLKRRLEEDDQIRELEREIRDLPLNSRQRLLERFPEHRQEMDANGALTINRAIKIASAGGIVSLVGWVGATSVYRLSNQPPDPSDPDWASCVLALFILTLINTIIYLYCYLACEGLDEYEKRVCRSECSLILSILYLLHLSIWAHFCSDPWPS